MAGVTDSLRGDGLSKVHRALDELEADPLGLDRARARFSQSPLSYRSNPSGTTTRSASPEPPGDEQRCREQREQRFQRRRKLMDERAGSLPLQQFKAQRNEERARIWNADPRTKMSRYRSIDTTFEKDASEVVKKRWIEQGIWKDRWDEMAAGRYNNVGRWKHEEPLRLEHESETDTEAEVPPPTFSIFGVPEKHQQPKLRRPKSNDERQRIAERRAVQEREHEASRPYHQFVFQMSKERERIQDKSANGKGANAADINTRAYENVKDTWTKRGVWNERWGIVPGMLWKHEEPLEEETASDSAPIPANPLENSNYEMGEAPAVRIFESTSPVESYRCQVSQQRQSADIDTARLEKGDAEPSPSEPKSPYLRTGEQILRPTTEQALLPSKRKTYQYRQPANASLGAIHPSRVSKAVGKRKGSQWQRNIPEKVSSDSLPLSSGVNAAELQRSPSPSRVALRRSKRIQQPILGVSENLIRMASINLSKRTVQSKTEQSVASSLTARSSAKPQGISKKQPTKITRRRARKK